MIKVRRLIIFALLVLLGVWLGTLRGSSGGYKIWFFDVGQGDAVLILTPGGRSVLVDGGPDNTILSELGKVLPVDQRRLDVIIISHAHADHIGGIIDVIKRYSVGYVFFNQSWYDSSEVTELVEQLDKKNIKVGPLTTENQIRIGDLLIEPLVANSAVTPGDLNAGSLVVEARIGKFNVLLTGDYELSGEQLGLANRIGTIDILKVPHQGSVEAVEEDTLAVLRPTVCVVSVGENSFGQPAPATMDLLGRTCSALYRTDQVGAVMVEIEPSGSNYRTTTKAGKVLQSISQ